MGQFNYNPESDRRLLQQEDAKSPPILPAEPVWSDAMSIHFPTPGEEGDEER